MYLRFETNEEWNGENSRTLELQYETSVNLYNVSLYDAWYPGINPITRADRPTAVESISFSVAFVYSFAFSAQYLKNRCS